MADHLYGEIVYPSENNNDIDDLENDTSSLCCTEDIDIVERTDDELLIELYRKRPFLYDKRDSYFKDRVVKENAWNEISQIMIDAFDDDLYAPEYCQKRCTSLRDQYSKEKRKADRELRSGSGSKKRNRFPYYEQMSFLDCVIQRRSSHSNCKPILNIDDSSTCYIKNTKNKVANGNENAGCSSNTSNTEDVNKENTAAIMRKRKIDDVAQELEQTLIQMGQQIINYMERKVSSADDAFFDFLKAQFIDIPDEEKNIRRKMLMDALSSPLNKPSHQEDCKRKVLLIG